MTEQPAEPTISNDSRPMAPFFIVWSGQAISLLGSNLVQFALIWYLTATTGSATVLAIASLVGLAPQIVLGPFAGALVDRWNRKRVMIFADAGIAFATIILAVLFAFDVVAFWHVYILLFIRSLGGTLHYTAMSASTALMVPEKHLTRISGLNQTLYGGVTIIGPVLGAYLLEILPMQGILAIDVATAALAIAPLLFIPIPQPKKGEPTGEEAPANIGRDVVEGMRYVWKWPGLFGMLVMISLANLLLQPAFALLPILVTEHFGGAAQELGWIEAGAGLGMLAGGLLLSAWGGFKQRVYTFIMGAAGIGAGMAVIGFTPKTMLPMAVGTIFFVGLMITAIDGPLVAILQANVDPNVQGRVMTLTFSAAKIMTVISLPIAGPIADLIGVQLWYRAAGIFCALLGVSGLLIPAIRNLEKDRPVPATSAAD
ncbi:MAG: MFS transporter [Anaerolineae bacterium]|nr:MFS transporter [Anaerolineae bacterium]